MDFACDNDIVTNVATASFKLDQPLSGVVLVEAVIDVIIANSQPVPPWWEFFGCRLGGIDADTDIHPGAVNCTDWSQAQGIAVVAGYNHDGSIAPADTASHRRILVSAVVSAPGKDLAANTDYFLLNFDLDALNTTGPTGCAGCAVPACLVLNSLRFLTSSAAVVTLESPNTPGGNFVTWQGGAGASCALVPVRRTTWGLVKSMYR
jgi:hypothetical protein